MKKNQIADFSLEEDQIWLQFENGEEDIINRNRFEKWLLTTNYLKLSRGTTASNYQQIGLDVEGFYRTEKVVDALEEYLSPVPAVLTQNKFRSLQNSAL